MTEIERYEPPRADVVRHDTDSWTHVIAEVGDLASKISNTEFVPESLRGKTAAVAAAILAGREMGVPPMTALSSIHVIKGRPAQSAQLMRQLVLAAGHQIRTVEANDTRCIVDGRRKGDEDWQQVTFTADQARKARIDLGGYPEDKLYARATSRLCRRVFADVLGGMPYSTEELTDGDVVLDEAPALPSGNGEAPAAEAPKKSMQRRSTKRQATTTRKQPEQPAAESADAGPPLPGETGYDETEQPSAAEPTDEPDRSGEAPGSITSQQSKKLHATFRDAGIDDRDQRLALVSRVLSRAVESSSDLSRDEAATLIDTLEELHRDGALVEMVAAMTQPDDSEGEQQ